MTLQELINKLNYLTDHRMTKDFSTNQNSDVHFKNRTLEMAKYLL